MKKIYLFLTALVMGGAMHAQIVVSTFDDLTLPPDSFWNGSNQSGGFYDGDAFFPNSYNTAYDFWSGWAYSDVKDSTTAGAANQYAANTASGYRGSANYAVAYDGGDTKIILDSTAAGKLINGFYITNSTYDYLSMLHGDQFAKKFGGATGNDPDWFKLTVIGWDTGVLVNNTVEFYLADYRFADRSKCYIVDDWVWVDLGALGNVDSIQLSLSSSDTGPYGMNTPAYFCIDNFTCNQLNAAPVAYDQYYNIPYNEDTLLNVLAGVVDSTALPLNIQVIYGPIIPGATAISEGNGIYYSPAPGIEAGDTITYSICNSGGLCAEATAYINVTGITAVKNVSMGESRVYPNPFTSSFTIEYSQPVDRYIIYDVQGRELQNTACRGEEKTTVNAANLPAGVYFIRLLSGDETTMTRMVKE